jgi:hypothetical protein
MLHQMISNTRNCHEKLMMLALFASPPPQSKSECHVGLLRLIRPPFVESRYPKKKVEKKAQKPAAQMND